MDWDHPTLVLRPVCLSPFGPARCFRAVGLPSYEEAGNPKPDGFCFLPDGVDVRFPRGGHQCGGPRDVRLSYISKQCVDRCCRRAENPRSCAVIRYSEHIEDVLAAWLEQRSEGGAALVAITLTEGGGVRAPGAVMTISRTGQRVGYISGGCLDADVARHALDALSDGKARKLRYGSGSHFWICRFLAAGRSKY
ncbi:XdhC family protein [Rhizobium leguminosarum]|uniref:XdhC family protein n=1 Tax=Rhizobium leguminosarum TaxID=384 RepID=UPI0009B7232A